MGSTFFGVEWSLISVTGMILSLLTPVMSGSVPDMHGGQIIWTEGVNKRVDVCLSTLGRRFGLGFLTHKLRRRTNRQGHGSPEAKD